MSNFESTSSSDVVLPTDTTTPTTATAVQETPSTTEAETAAEAIMNAQPTGETPSAAEIEGRTTDARDAQSAVENLLPREKLENGFRNARSIVAMGWASLAARVKELEETETVAKIKEGTVTIVDRSMDGLSKVGSKVAEVTDSGVKIVGEKMEEAAPTIGRWRDNVVIASEGAYASAKEITDKAISDIRSRPGGDGTAGSGSAGGVWGASGSAPGSGSSASGAEAGDGEDGPHTV